MNEKISRLMDGELPDDEFDRTCASLVQEDAWATWACYHVIGDALRGQVLILPGFRSGFAAKLASEPTVLAPRSIAPASMPRQVATWAWAAVATVAAVTVVGWTAYSLVDETPAALAKAREAGTLRAASIRPPARVPADYLLAHEEFSPAIALQGAGPFMRAAVAPEETRR